MFERFTITARRVVVMAKAAAESAHSPAIGTEHLLLGLLDEEAGGASQVLRAAGVDREQVVAAIGGPAGPDTKLLSDADADALRTIGIDLDTVVARIEESFGPGALANSQARAGGLFRRRRGPRSRFSPRSRKVLGLALREAVRLHHDWIGSEHILLGLLREGNGLAARILVDHGADLDELRRATLRTLDQAA